MTLWPMANPAVVVVDELRDARRLVGRAWPPSRRIIQTPRRILCAENGSRLGYALGGVWVAPQDGPRLAAPRRLRSSSRNWPKPRKEVEKEEPPGPPSQ
jgi:hypothetical protein